MIFIMNLSLPYASFSHTIPTAIRTFFKLCEALVALPDLDEGSDGLRIESVFFEEGFDFFPGVGVVLSAILVLDDELDGEVGSLRIGDFCVLFGGVVAEPDPVVVGVADVEGEGEVGDFGFDFHSFGIEYKDFRTFFPYPNISTYDNIGQ